MEITLAMVTSLDGRITDKNGEVYSWTSTEDQVRYKALRDEYSVIIMSRKIYDEVKSKIVLSPKKLRIIMTREASKYQDLNVPNQLEYSSLSPTEIVQDLAKRGYTRVLLSTGSELSASFLKEGLVTRFILTIEPVILGEGLPLVAGVIERVKLELISMERLNDQGTLLCDYRVLKS